MARSFAIILVMAYIQVMIPNIQYQSEFYDAQRFDDLAWVRLYNGYISPSNFIGAALDFLRNNREYYLASWSDDGTEGDEICCGPHGLTAFAEASGGRGVLTFVTAERLVGIAPAFHTDVGMLERYILKELDGEKAALEPSAV